MIGPTQKIGQVIRPRQQGIADARNQQGMPIRPLNMQRPVIHFKTGKPPTQNYRRGHPMLTSPNVRPALPVKATTGVPAPQVQAYVRALNGQSKPPR